MVKKVIIFAGLVILFAATILNLVQKRNTEDPKNFNKISNVVEKINKIGSSPTPFPFDGLTIPYLREKVYESSLGEMVKLSENSSYTSYRTSYLSDGYKVYGLLTVPNGTSGSKYPAIVFVHGYIAPTIYKTNERYVAHVDYLARRGFVVIKIDLRGHDRSEGEAMGAYYAGDYVVDTLSAYSALQNAAFVNPEKIGLWGHSMAGNVTFRSFVAKKDIPAIVIWAGAGYTYSDLSEFRINDNSYRPPSDNTERARKRRELAERYGPFDPNSWFWKQVPATNYLEGVSGALQINHAEDDDVVSIEYSRNLMKILNNTKITHELHEYDSGGHNISGVNFSRAMKNTSDFFQNFLN